MSNHDDLSINTLSSHPIVDLAVVLDYIKHFDVDDDVVCMYMLLQFQRVIQRSLRTRHGRQYRKTAKLH